MNPKLSNQVEKPEGKVADVWQAKHRPAFNEAFHAILRNMKTKLQN